VTPPVRRGAGWNGVGASAYLATAGMSATGLLYGDFQQFKVQLGGATLCAMYGIVLTFVVFSVANKIQSMRVAVEVELEVWMFRNSGNSAIRKTRTKQSKADKLLETPSL
jgi:ammonia channel protein AmtB